jgi:uncharacterized protein (DUF362 family)
VSGGSGRAFTKGNGRDADMENTVGVIRGGDRRAALVELLDRTDFDGTLERAWRDSGSEREKFPIAVKPNLMVYVNPNGAGALVTDPVLVEDLIDRILERGFRDVAVVESRNDVGRMFRNHTVSVVAERIGYRPEGRYRIVDLTTDSESFRYPYRDRCGREKVWKDRAGTAWKRAGFRISFAKCKTHEHDWLTLSVKNAYGCLPRSDKVQRYHIREEVFDVTARALRSFPLHFAVVDAWTASDGFQGYKIPNPRDLRMLFAGRDAIAVDMEVFRRAGLDPGKSRFLGRAVEQTRGGEWPRYGVVGDAATRFSDVSEWRNVTDDIVRSIDVLEEVYVAWGLINMKAGAEVVDYGLFPPRNLFSRAAVWITKKMYAVFKGMRWYRRLYQG